ncbi:MAG TPA: hypothetical protein VMU87_08430 [Stellaceae bacterium]|nr:hypothetical protein [Stellaceae bacterium]
MSGTAAWLKVRRPGPPIAAPTAEAAILGGARGRIGISLPIGLGLGVYLVGLASPRMRLDDPDIMLHIVTGRWIIVHHAVPHVDFLSYTVPGRPWVAHEWLGEVITALCYDRLGWHGLVALASLGLGAAVLIFARALLRYYGPAATVVIVAAAWFVVTPHWLARPHIFAFPFLIAWMALLVRARDENRAPHPATALIMIPWVNLHATFLVGIGFTLLFMTEAVLLAKGEAQRLDTAKRWTVFMLLALIATMITPNGIEAYLLPLRLLNMRFALSVLVEWKSIDFQHMSTFELWLLLYLGVVLCRGIRLPLARTLMTLLLLAMSLPHQRNAELLAFLAPLIAAPYAAPQLARSRPVPAGAPLWLDRLARPAAARGWLLAGAVIFATEAASFAFPLTPGNRFMPVAAVRTARAYGLTGHVLNAYDYGDYLLFAGIKPFIDGRADMYGDAFIKRDFEATRGISDGLPALLAEYQVEWTIFPKNSRAVIQLDRMTGWHRLYADDVAVVHVRDGAAPANRGR